MTKHTADESFLNHMSRNRFRPGKEIGMGMTFAFAQNRLIDFFNAITDGIYITDGSGTTLWLNDTSEKNLNYPRTKLIGTNSFEMEKTGLFSPSVVRLVLDSQDTVSVVQTVNHNRQYLVTGHPLFDSQGAIEYIVIHSRDITHAVKLTTQLEEMESLLNRYSEELRALKLERDKDILPNPLIYNSSVYESVMQTVDKIARYDTTVLITGETGVGKNVVAHRIHKLSSRSNQPFVEVNCGAITESLLESELFGYKKGAFTGANPGGKIGLVQLAHGGTLFLDEIANLSLHLQSKLLHFIQSKAFRMVGDTEVKTSDTRIISATNADLPEMVKNGTFRADLYYRLNIIPITIPSLRNRKEDIIPLLYFFLEKFNRKYNVNRKFSSAVLKLMDRYDWPGNIRELENTMERLVITAMADTISVSDLPEYLTNTHTVKHIDIFRMENKTMPDILEEIEREMIEEALKEYKTTRRAADALGISQSLLMRRIKKYNLVKNE